MSSSSSEGTVGARIVAATFGRQEVRRDPTWERDFAEELRAKNSRDELLAQFARFRTGESSLDVTMRRVLLRSLCKSMGDGLQISPDVMFKHPETMNFGDAVFIGAQSMIQGRYDGQCKIGNHVWIGPHAYFDARDLVLEDYVGWGPGAKVLGSQHTGEPIDVPIIKTSLLIKPVVIGYGADIGTNATVLPGVHIGAHAIVGAGAVVTTDIPDYAVAAGVPARVIRTREGAVVNETR